MKRPRQDEKCVICLEENNDKSTELICGHQFHSLCLEHLQEICANVCPLCRTKFPRNIPQMETDNKHWKLFTYGSEIFIQWVSEFESIVSAMYHINLYKTTLKLTIIQESKNQIPITDLWISTRESADYSSKWIEKEYPVFVHCENIIYDMLAKNEVSCKLQYLCSQFIFVFDGKYIYYSKPKSKLFRFITNNIFNRFALRQERCRRMAGTNVCIENFDTIEQLIAKITYCFTIAESVPYDLKKLISYLIFHPDCDDYVLEESKHHFSDFYQIGGYSEDIQEDWSWKTSFDLWEE
jgi:hypothetical protein